ncbi:MAG: carboxynorspermidine decarboxylase [Oscillospiraceae bacterium]|nr:carboxynorspermidine decarboxylase [Oscillospiraceae bacterium]
MNRNSLPTPCYIVSEAKIRENCEILRGVMDRTGCKILLAQKAFSMYSLYPLIGEYLSGAASSGLFEARLAREHFPGESHVFSAAFRPDDFPELFDYADKIIFNSNAELQRYGLKAMAAGKSIGLRINPEHSTQEGSGIYDPCAPGSRLGVCADQFDPDCLELLDGLHFHTLCEQDAAPLIETVAAFENKFGWWLHALKWINFGGGHHITRPGYDIAALEACIRRVQETYGVEVYLEPGEAIAYHAGWLETTVLDIVTKRPRECRRDCHHDHGDKPPPAPDVAILDASAACHMPDVLEMPYRPPLTGSGEPGEKPHTYRLAGPTCLAGDVIGDYSFDQPLTVGDRICFEDMAIYTMVKNNTFNGMPLPAIAIESTDGTCHIVRQFGYEDFKMRL